MGVMQKRKGKAGEAEAEAEKRRLGWRADRTSLLQAGGHDASDMVSSLEGELVHRDEVKFVKQGFTPSYDAYAQACKAARPGETPCVIYRQTDTPRKRKWMITLSLEDYTRNVKAGRR